MNEPTHDSYGCLMPLACAVCILIPLSVVLDFEKFYDALMNDRISIWGMSFLLSLFTFCASYIFHYSKIEALLEELKTKERDSKDKITSLKKTHKCEIDALIIKIKQLEETCKQLNLHLTTSIPYKLSASLYANTVAVIYKKEETFLRTKQHPAYTAAEVVSKLKEKTMAYECQYKEMLFKYETLMSLFPELEKYVDDISYLKDVHRDTCLDDVQQNYDRVRDWLTVEEYRNLSVEERNQRALDLYLKRKMSQKEVGDDYEMYIGWLLREKGYEVQMFGIERGLEDLGRDIIAFKNVDLFSTSKHILIVQCKRWSHRKEIHENVLCQLYGTTVQYIISQKGNIGSDTKVYPVLVTTAPLSSTANTFANYLGVKVRVVPMGNYPRIKCNINNGNKIYHLPFDQQYRTTQIKENGECYVYTVKEAMELGFRRAFRWHGLS